LASKRLAIRSTPFDREWNRVRGSGLARSVGSAAFGREHGKLSLTALSAVNIWANTTIRYVEDRELYGQADRWATAGETLRRRAGDCEDIAIVKMQLLASQGVSREDMALVIARDLVRGADHAVLVVRLGDRNWLLDNATDQVLDASLSYDYRPIMSFSAGKKWLHGY
jgi:predicted transglutaminase-like cysteine proteinase